MTDPDDPQEHAERDEAVACTLAVLARPVTSAEIPPTAALDMLSDAPRLIEDALALGETARVAFAVSGDKAHGRVCADDESLAKFFRAANARGANVTAVSPARVLGLTRTIRRATAATLRPATTGGLHDQAIH